MKITLKAEHYNYDLYGQQSKEPLSTITYETKNDTLDGILEDFTNFLRGCGFQIDGYIDVVPYDEMPSDIHDHYDINEEKKDE